MDYALCPQCDLPAEVIGRFHFQHGRPDRSRQDGLPAGHVFTPPADDGPTWTAPRTHP